MELRLSHWIGLWVRTSIFILAAIPATPFANGQASPPAATASQRRVEVAADVASALAIKKADIQYPDAARKAGIQGTVVLNVVTSDAGDVKNVTVLSGDPALAQAAVDSLKQWKYKPYLADGTPVEMETEVSINFHIKAAPRPDPPPLGTFKDGVYANAYFDLSYPLSRDWVRETDLMRKKISDAGHPSAMYVLLAALHIPEHTTPPEAASSFIVTALERSANSPTQTCELYLQKLASDLNSRKEAQQQGDQSEFNIAGRDFRRADFDFRSGPKHHAIICMQAKDYLLQWNVAGSSKNAVQGAVSTIDSITGAPPLPLTEASHDQSSNDNRGSHPVPAAPEPPQVTYIRVSSGVTQGLVVKKVQPNYPQEARYNHIQGSVHLSAVINKTGDVVDLEVIDGPIELVVSAVNAVRQWKYRPYILKGEPMAVQTVITVNYQLSGG